MHRLGVYLATNLVQPIHTPQQVRGFADLVYVRHLLVTPIPVAFNIAPQHAVFWRQIWCVRRQSDWARLIYLDILEENSPFGGRRR
jgi:hypothetical protein